MSNLIRHPYHLVDESPWPLISSIGRIYLTFGLLKLFYEKSANLITCGILLILSVMLLWWQDVRAEGAFQGLHSNIVELGLRWGMILFIISEIFFFVSFFWSFFHRRLVVEVILGMTWPPSGIFPFNPFHIPLLNTIVLLRSGVAVTWSHHAIISGNYDQMIQGLGFTIFLGIYFSLLQLIEYIEASFRMADRVYGSVFFIATGFHGLHVIVGTIFLVFSFIRIAKKHFRRTHHFGFEAAVWYWHFVDVVWLFLFMWIYWWGRF